MVTYINFMTIRLKEDKDTIRGAFKHTIPQVHVRTIDGIPKDIEPELQCIDPI